MSKNVTLRLLIDGLTYNISDAVRSYESVTRACNEEFRHAVSERHVTLSYSSDLLSLLTQDQILVQVDVDGVRDFTGRIAPSSIQTTSYGAGLSQPDVDDITIELEDNTYLLQREIASQDNLVIENAAVCDPAQPDKSCVHRLLSLCGATIQGSVAIPTTLLAFAPDPGTTVLETLDALLYEYGYTFAFDAYGTVQLVQVIYDTPTPQKTLTETEIQAGLRVEKLIKEADIIEVEYYPLKAKSDVLLYMADLPFGDDGLRSGWPIQSGYLWPEEANVQETWFEYSDKAIGSLLDARGNVIANKDFTSIVLTKNHTVEQEVDDGVIRPIAIFENKRCRLTYKNIDPSPRNIYYCNVKGDVIYRSAKNTSTKAIAQNPAKKDIYQAQYVHDEGTANRLCGFRAERQKGACWRYTFKTDTPLSSGMVIRLIDPYSQIDAIALVSEISWNADTDEVEYKAIGIVSPVVSFIQGGSVLLPEPTGTSDADLVGARYEPRYQRAPSQPATPTGDDPAGWYTDPSQAVGTDPIWITIGLKSRDGILQGSWSVPVKLTGDSAIVGMLTNDTHTVPTDSAGNNGVYTGCSTTMYIYVGATDDSANWTVAATPSSGVTGSLSGKTYTVTNMTVDSGYVDLVASRSGYPNVTCRFTITKAKQGTTGAPGATGAPATAYWLVSSVAAIKKSESGVYTPSSVTFNAKSATGTNSPVNYAGRFIIAETLDGATYTDKYTSSADEATKTYTPSANIKALRCRLYLAGGTTTLLDEETVPVVSDGPTGPTGPTGQTGNYYEVRYQRASSVPATPTGDNPTGWYTDPSQATGTSPIWMTRGVKNYAGVLQDTWTTPVKITGENYLSGNLINPDAWVLGTSGNQPGFNVLYADSDVDCSIILDTGPFGNLVPMMKVTDADATSDYDGGWHGGTNVYVDTNKKYRFVLYLKRSATNKSGVIYFGPGINSAVCNLSDGAINTNPYFKSDYNPPIDDRWYCIVGYVYPASYTGTTGEGGVYDMVTGAKVASTADFKWASGVTSTYCRAYLHYSTVIGSTVYFHKPAIEVCNGLEPPLSVLVPATARSAKYLGTTTDNPPISSTFSNDRIAGDWCLSSTAKAFYRWTGTAWTTTGITTAMKMAALQDMLGVADASDTTTFVQTLVAVDAFINNLFSKYVKVTGSIRTGERFDAAGNIINNQAVGTWIGSNGVLKTRDAIIDGFIYAYDTPFMVVAAFNITDNGGTRLLSGKNISTVLKISLGCYRLVFQTPLKVKHYTDKDGHKYINVYVFGNAHSTFERGFMDGIHMSINWVRNYIEGRLSYDSTYAYVTYADIYFFDNNNDSYITPIIAQGIIAISETR
uniref:Tail protein n=1 Tax=Gracilinema caldarium TaxID=215591 RepID=A0A7C3E1A3_9SPIR